jgi:hypothetical protein
MKPKNIFAFFFILMLLIQIQSCNKVENHKFQSYINTYMEHKDIGVYVTDSGNIQLRGEMREKLYSWRSTGYDKEVYDSLCNANNDISYNKKRDFIAAPEWGLASTLCINGIDIISNTDFDQNHLAGASLNDIVMFISVSPKRYIDSGYIDTHNWETAFPNSFEKEQRLYRFKNYPDRSYYFPIEKLLSEMHQDEIKMTIPEFSLGFLVFEFEPTGAKEHELTITISLCDGSNIEKTLVKVFD